ncbi:hypothetical protein RP726_05955 [Candidatus Methylospira mobilis]|uniref:hypothetical protein n=1 Tax=Candidatus Methylospira mobilis TaxID=1808979 RepID=UPI0028E86C9A|nr:hypothetical protein [Candidatus Methylospira mobilis]WNV05957.1 hypothetical protein RP726_05955 [Candidatus Methylospira mobilis]
MKLRHRLSVFTASARLGFKQVLDERLGLLGGFLMYATLVIAYAGVFRWIPADNLAGYRLSFSQLVWYLGTTEFVLFCGSFAYFRELQQEIQSDQIHLALLRPCPVWVVKLGEWSGQYTGRFIVLALPCYVLSYCTAGQTGPGFDSVAGIVASLPMAGFIMVACTFMLGASCLWLTQAEPAFWIWQKCLFLLGALLWPLALYPGLMSRLVWLTPFPSMLAVLGAWIVSNDGATHMAGFFHQIFWVIVCVALVAATNRAMLRRIQAGG